MKQILIASGKGGTGKTSISAAFASLAKQAVFADCDVDASDLHLLLSPEILQSFSFISGKEASINQTQCSICGKCYQLCRFEAIMTPDHENQKYRVNPIACDGCGVCVKNCPEQAISFIDKDNGEYYHSHTRFGELIHAQLHPGGENSGKLVSLVRKKALDLAKASNLELVLIDGPPGIGCPVIASLTGCDLLLIVVEPSLSSLHDAKRLIQLSKHFSVPCFILINKWDISPILSKQMESEFKNMKVKVLGKLPYDTEFIRAMMEGKTIIEYHKNGKTASTLMSVWKELLHKNENQPYLIKKEGSI
ncbi:MAG TPA: ATP-binding protein [Caldisericia bacterium]|nr:ATP-binding protein [Caldisericia bacterium]